MKGREDEGELAVNFLCVSYLASYRNFFPEEGMDTDFCSSWGPVRAVPRAHGPQGSWVEMFSQPLS